MCLDYPYPKQRCYGLLSQSLDLSAVDRLNKVLEAPIHIGDTLLELFLGVPSAVQFCLCRNGQRESKLRQSFRQPEVLRCASATFPRTLRSPGLDAANLGCDLQNAKGFFANSMIYLNGGIW